MFRKTLLYALALGLGSVLSGNAHGRMGPGWSHSGAKGGVGHSKHKKWWHGRRHSKSYRRMILRHKQHRLSILHWREAHPKHRAIVVSRHIVQVISRQGLTRGKILAMQGKPQPSNMRFGPPVPQVAGQSSVSMPITTMRAIKSRFAPPSSSGNNEFNPQVQGIIPSPIARVDRDMRTDGPALVMGAPLSLPLQRGSVIIGVRSIDQAAFTPVHKWDDLATFLKNLPDELVLIQYRDEGRLLSTIVSVNGTYAAPSGFAVTALAPGLQAARQVDVDPRILGLSARDPESGLMALDLRSHALPGAAAEKLSGETVEMGSQILRPAADPGIDGQGPFARVTADAGEGKGAIVKTAAPESSLTPGCAIIGIRTVEQTFFKRVNAWADIVEFVNGLPDDEIVVRFRQPGGIVGECTVRLFHK